MNTKKNYISNSFFHFTRTLDSVKGILRDGFKLYYCNEDIYLKKGSHRGIGIPMLCFCDIPLSFLSLKDKRPYGFGMNKRNWAWNKVKFQPVYYYPNNARCYSTKLIINASQSFIYGGNPADYRILGVAKPYYGIKNKNECNYLENEWRIIEDETTWYADTDSRFKLNSASGTIKTPYGTPVSFTPKDIDFIIVPEADKPAIIDYIINDLKTCCGKNLSKDDIVDLISKIVVREKIVKNI